MANDTPQRPAHATAQRTKSHFPAELRALPRWITWALGTTPTGKTTKRPANGVSTLRPEEWRTFSQLGEAPITREQGIGFVLTGDPSVKTSDGTPLRVIVLDLDACLDEKGEPAPWARELLDAYPNTFVERSPSGRGLHVALAVRRAPPPLSLIRIDGPAIGDKRPNVQVFGTGPAGYVTMTGDLLPGAPRTLGIFPDLTWLEQRYTVGTFAPPEATVDLPHGDGEPPTFDQLEQSLRADPATARLIAGDWQTSGLPSASEGWWRLSRAALRAAHGHGATAARFLISRTAYGIGAVDSRDPARYARLEWVERDLARIAGKTGDVGAAAFADEFNPDTWEPPLRPQPTPGDPWVLPFETFRQRRAAQRYLLKHFLPARGLAQFFGDPASGKTPFAISLAVHVAAGQDWFRHKLKRPGSVVYMVGEDEGGIIDRITAQLTKVDPLLDLGALPLFATTRPGQLIDADNRKRWVAEIRRALEVAPDAPPLSLVVIDTQNRNFGPGNENETEAMSAFVTQLDALGRQLDALILLVHHTGHLNKERGRGSSVLFGALDACFEVTRDAMTVVLTPRKNKGWKEPEPIFAGLSPVTIGVDDDGEDVTAITLDDSPPEPVDVFSAEAPADGVLELLHVVAGLDGRRVSQQELAQALTVTRKQLRARIDDATRARLIRTKAFGPKMPAAYFLTEAGREKIAARPAESLGPDEKGQEGPRGPSKSGDEGPSKGQEGQENSELPF